ncbi:MAG: ABC transporter substrate-binding protein [Betaproteobacteria bacterium]|nr:ABC transporter substrate-binding protein [Betaproteobacteria bacterium]
MNRRETVVLFALLALVALSPAAEARPSVKLHRIGYLSIAPGPGGITGKFLDGMRDLGYVEGRNFVMEYRWAAFKNERLPELANDLIRAKVDVIVTDGPLSTVAAQQATRTIPIVFGSMGSPAALVERGFVASLVRPGGNITGVALDLGATRIVQLLKEAVPKASNAAFLYDPAKWTGPAIESLRARMNAAAKPLGVNVKWIAVRDSNDVTRAFDELEKGTDALLLENSTSIFALRKHICALALQRRLPAVGYASVSADAGCLMGYMYDLGDMRRRTAKFVDRILRGARPAELPIEEPEKFELAVNLDTANALGLVLPATLLAQAARSIKATSGTQQAARAYKIGVLSLADRPDSRYGPIFDRALRERGYEVGRNLAMIPRYAAGKPEQLPVLVADLIRQNVDIILTVGSSETLAAVKATTAIPIVFVSPSPVELGIVRSLARPGGNATGLSADVAPEFIGKFLELLKQSVPRLTRVALMWNPDRPEDQMYEKAMREAGRVLRVELRFVNVRVPRDLEAAFASFATERADALMIAVDSTITSNQKRITNFALKNHLPTISYERAVTDDGGLMSYGPHTGDILRGLAIYIDKILKGAKPADLPVEQPRTFELVVNMKTAKALGLAIPQSLLMRADEVIR